MLNELYDAGRSLAIAGITPKEWHKEYVPVRRPKLAFFVYINDKSEMSDIECVSDPKVVEDLRTWESKGDLRQSFPYFNVPPLLWIHFDPKADANDKVIDKALKDGTVTHDQLNEFIDNTRKDKSTREWSHNAYKKLKACLNKGLDLKAILDDGAQGHEAVAVLVDRAAQLTEKAFYNRLHSVFRCKMLNCPNVAQDYFDGLFYSGQDEPHNTMTLFLEIANGLSRFEFPVKHATNRDWINARLLAKSTTQASACLIADIFGKSGTGQDEKFDDVRLKNALGIVKLRAMVAEAPCQYRYGRAEAASCPVGQESRSTMKGALEWLSDPVREGRTWVSVSRAVDNKELLLAYPSILPPEPPDMATFFGGSVESKTDVAATGRFEDCAANVTRALNGLIAHNPNLDIRVFVLRKMDAARTRISSQRRYSAQHLIKSASEWKTGCSNLPHIVIKQFVQNGKIEWCEPLTPYPMEVVWVLNTRWARNGESANRVKGIGTEAGISLLLEVGSFVLPVVRRALHLVTHNSLGLALALGQAHAQGHAFSPTKKYRRQALLLPSILALLLYKLNITREICMKSAPYLVGRLLSLADQLHYHYCKHVRDNSVPRQLMGNAVMATALEEPVKALALYSNRILPYQAWARTFRGDDDENKRVRGTLKKLGEVCAEVSLESIPERCSDADKAQLLIGYLARG